MNNIEIIFKNIIKHDLISIVCCRECIRKWHKIQPGKELSRIQQDYLVDVIMTWIQSEVDRYNS